jgi:hypothetical protein
MTRPRDRRQPPSCIPQAPHGRRAPRN